MEAISIERELEPTFPMEVDSSSSSSSSSMAIRYIYYLRGLFKTFGWLADKVLENERFISTRNIPVHISVPQEMLEEFDKKKVSPSQAFKEFLKKDGIQETKSINAVAQCFICREPLENGNIWWFEGHSINKLAICLNKHYDPLKTDCTNAYTMARARRHS
jgi:hypothetical protein